MSKAKPGIISTVFDLISSYIKRVSDLTRLMKLEAQLAVKTLAVIGILIFIMGSVLTTFWLSVLIVLFFYLLSLHYTLLGAALFIAGVNLILLTSIFLVIYKIKDNLFFKHTIHQMTFKPIDQDEATHERIATEN
jgi:hypothetical protein